MGILVWPEVSPIANVSSALFAMDFGAIVGGTTWIILTSFRVAEDIIIVNSIVTLWLSMIGTACELVAIFENGTRLKTKKERKFSVLLGGTELLQSTVRPDVQHQ